MATMSGQWGYSVPLDETDGNARSRTKRQNTLSSQERDVRSLKSTTRRPSDHAGVQSDSEETRQRRRSVKASNAGRLRSHNSRKDMAKDRAAAVTAGAGERDESAWIHRDKLAQIEIQEMVDAGIPIRQSRRSLSAEPSGTARSSRSLSRSGPSPDEEESEDQQHQVDESLESNYENYEKFERKRISTIPAADEEEAAYEQTAREPDTNAAIEADTHTTTEAHTHTPEEGAPEQRSPTSPSSGPTVRPSTSRIPISAGGPVPVPQNVVDRNEPLTRSRQGSLANSGHWDETQYVRHARSNSFGSQALLDDDGTTSSAQPGSALKGSSSDSSPPKSGASGENTSAARGRASKNDRPGSSAGKKTNGTNPSPGARSGHTSRPSTSHRQAPQGNPPWMSNMYKPDPRLPPDQQMLPTHAKRLAQEQWEKEGKTGTAYDREFRLLNNDDFGGGLLDRQKSNNSQAAAGTAPTVSLDRLNLDDFTQPSLQHTLLQRDNGNTSPGAGSGKVSPLSDRHRSTSPTRPGTNSGGYRITPTIITPPTMPKSPAAETSGQGFLSAAGTSPVAGGMEGRSSPPRVPVLDEKDEPQPKKAGGCGCCVVM